MKSEVEQLSPVERKVSMEVPWETLNKELDKAYRSLAKRAQIKGFRAGKVPRKVVEQMYRGAVEHEVLNRLIDEAVRGAIDEHDLFPIAPPSLEELPTITKGEPLRFDVKIEVKPEIEIGEFKGLAVERTIREVEDSEVDDELKKMQDKATVVEPVTDRTEAASGDLAVVDFFGSIDGEDFKGGKGISYTVEIGGGQMIPGFEEQLIGMKIGDEKHFSLAFPEPYNAPELQGKTADWKVDLKELKTKLVPALDDEFAKDLGEFDTLQELKDNLRNNLATREDAKAKSQLRDETLKALVEKNEVTVPPAMVENQLNYMLRDLDQMMKNNAGDPQMQALFSQVRTENRAVAEQQVAGMLLLEAIGRKENIEVDDQELDARIQDLAREHDMGFQQLKADLRKNDQLDALRHSVAQDKALDLVIEHAQITERKVTAAELAAEEAAKAAAKAAADAAVAEPPQDADAD